jgi:hypothetical protein
MTIARFAFITLSFTPSKSIPKAKSKKEGSDTFQAFLTLEGSTGPGFQTWLLVQNPQSSDAHVTLTFMTEAGELAGPALVVGAHRRATVDLATCVPGRWSVSTEVRSDRPVSGERSLYGVR